MFTVTCRWYVVGDSGTQPRIILNTDTETMDFVKSFDDDDDAELAVRRHTDNLAAAEGHLEAEVSPKLIIPTPLKIELMSVSGKTRQVHIDSYSWTVLYDGQQLHNEAKFIASET